MNPTTVYTLASGETVVPPLALERALDAYADRQHKDGSRRRKTEHRAYRCPKCGGWHLTSRR